MSEKLTSSETPSTISGFEYDIFISYRHNDNRSGWVSDFVIALQEELPATIKTPLSIYFDKNQHDGLLKTDHVNIAGGKVVTRSMIYFGKNEFSKTREAIRKFRNDNDGYSIFINILNNGMPTTK